jgi:radical SAM protein with 4Fe4S-binding SPASM domain
MLKWNAPFLTDTLEFLGQLGLKTVGLNALIYSGRGKTVGTGLSESELMPLLDIAKQVTEKYKQRLIWYTPTEYCHFDPVQMQLGVKGCTAALYNMCIEPDGSVIPCQSYYQSLGKLLENSWDSIWNHPLSQKLRNRQELPEKCHSCLLVQECGGGCPLKFESISCESSSQEGL